MTNGRGWLSPPKYRKCRISEENIFPIQGCGPISSGRMLPNKCWDLGSIPYTTKKSFFIQKKSLSVLNMMMYSCNDLLIQIIPPKTKFEFLYHGYKLVVFP
jgi:hypothetical protein